MSLAPTEIAQRVIELSRAQDAAAVLSLAQGLPPVTRDTAVPEARRSYMRLATLIHPDKLKGFERATEAFQALVRMFEHFCSPAFKAADVAAKPGKGAAKRGKAGAGEPTAKAARADTEAAAAAAAKTQAKKKAKKRRSSDSDESESEPSEDDEDDEDEAAPSQPAVNPARVKLDRGRSNDGCVRTLVGCPNCKTSWQPDDNKQYSLFMAYGLKIHCQLCLLCFGCNTAVHACPACEAGFEYDASMYDGRVRCARASCKYIKQPFGFMFYPVTQAHVDNIAAEERAAEAAAAKAAERAQRARARDAGTSEEERVMQLVGQCVLDEKCPLCKTAVKKKHKTHILECMAAKGGSGTAVAAATAAPASETVGSVAAAKASPAARGGKKAAAPAAKKAPAPKKAPPKKAPAKKRRRDDSDDDDDDDESDASDSDESEDSDDSDDSEDYDDDSD